MVAFGHENAMIKAKIKSGCFNWFVSKIVQKFKLDQNLNFSLKYNVDIQGKRFNVRIQDDEDMENLNSYNEKGNMLCNLVNVTAMQTPGAIASTEVKMFGLADCRSRFILINKIAQLLYPYL